jgi:hypothetical protein
MLSLKVSAQDVSISYGGPNNGQNLRQQAIPTDFLGISLESSSVVSTGSGKPQWLNGHPSPFLTLLRTTGIRSIRIGGNSAERTGYPSLQDAVAVNDFVQALHGSLLWVLPAKNNEYSVGTPAQYATFAVAMETDRRRKGYTFPISFLISNEPDLYMKGRGDNADSPIVPYEIYEERFQNYKTLLRSSKGGPTVSGPSFAKDPSYAVRLAQNSTPRGVGYITGHTYPLGAAGSHGENNSDEAVKALLADNHAKYQAYYDKWGAPAAALGYRTRIDETNSMYFSGARQDLLHEYAAALWVLDYLCYDATHTNLGGMNLHNGPIGSNGYNTFSPIGPASHYTLSAVGYGMFAFSRGSHGIPTNAEVTENPVKLDLSTYAVHASDGSTFLYVINRTLAATTADAMVSIPARKYTHVDVMYLKQTSSDVRAEDGITLGSQPVRPDGTWTGHYDITGKRPKGGRFRFKVPHLQAAIVHLTR